MKFFIIKDYLVYEGSPEEWKSTFRTIIVRNGAFLKVPKLEDKFQTVLLVKEGTDKDDLISKFEKSQEKSSEEKGSEQKERELSYKKEGKVIHYNFRKEKEG